MIDGVLGRNCPAKRLAEAWHHRMEGERQQRKARNELLKIMQERPTYQIPDELKTNVKP